LLHSVTNRRKTPYLVRLVFPIPSPCRAGKNLDNMLFVKLFLVALSLLVQDKVFPKHEAPVSELDTLTFPVDKPETALARRAMAAEGLCPALIAGAAGAATDTSGLRGDEGRVAETREPRSYPPDSLPGLAAACD
jgi:hypothetical protein